MGTKERRLREKERRRQKILEAAKKLFFEKGFVAATMDQIAHNVELSKGTLYLYFKNKEELYISLLVEGMALLNNTFKSAIKNKIGWKEKIRSIGWAYYRYSRDYNPFFHIIFQFQYGEITANISDELSRKCTRGGLACLGYLSRAIAGGIRTDEIRQQDPMSLAVVLWGSLTGIILLHEGKDHQKFIPYPIEQLVEQNIEMAVHGLTTM